MASEVIMAWDAAFFASQAKRNLDIKIQISFSAEHDKRDVDR
jgi:hypothetical protein